MAINGQAGQLPLQVQHDSVPAQERVVIQRQCLQATHAADGWRQHVQAVAVQGQLCDLLQSTAAAGQILQLIVGQQKLLQERKSTHHQRTGQQQDICSTHENSRS